MSNSKVKKPIRKGIKGPPFAPAVIKAADLQAYDLTMLTQFYWTLRGCIDDFGELTKGGSHAEAMFTLVDRRFVAPLDHALDACHAAIKAAKPKDHDETERQAALLYEHALSFDGSNDERRAILAGAILAIPADVKSETIRFRKTKFGEGGELHIVKDKDGTDIWRQWTPRSELRRLEAERRAAKQKAAKRKTAA